MATSTVLKEGFLLKSKDQKRKSWNQKWVILSRGALYYYRKKTNFSPAGVLELKDYDLEDNPEVRTEKKNVFVLRSKEKAQRVLFAASTEQERDEWIALIKQQVDKEPAPPPENPSARGKGAKYTIQANVASSLIGRKLIKEIVDPDSWKALDAICSFIKQVRGEEVATKFKKDLVKIGTKLAILHHNKLVTDEAILKMNQAVIQLAQTVVDYYQMPSIFDAATLVSYVNALRSATEPHLENKIKPKTMQKFKDLFVIGCSEELHTNLFEKDKWPELGEISAIIRKHITSR